MSFRLILVALFPSLLGGWLLVLFISLKASDWFSAESLALLLGPFLGWRVGWDWVRALAPCMARLSAILFPVMPEWPLAHSSIVMPGLDLRAFIVTFMILLIGELI